MHAIRHFLQTTVKKAIQSHPKRCLSTSAAGMDAFLEFEREMASKRKPTKVDLTHVVPKPEEPKQEECCGLDCASCVWIVYQEKMLEYEAYVNAKKTQQTLLPPKIERRYEIHFLADNEITHEMKSRMETEISNHHPAIECLIKENKELCYDRKILHTQFRSTKSIRFDISSHPGMKQYAAADNLAVYMPNTDDAIERCVNMLGVDRSRWFRIKSMGTDELPCPDTCTVEAALKWFCDLSCTLRRSAVQSLASFAAVESEKQALLQLTTPGSKQFSTEVLGKQLTILDLLEKYPSIHIDFEMFLQLAPRSAPRFYTITSSPRKTPNEIEIVVRKHEEEVGNSIYKGLCSNYLSSLQERVDKAWISVSDSTFRLPPDPHVPVIMVGPGTGLAPFRAFLFELEHAKKRLHNPGLTSLFYGCQHPQVDYLYQEEIQELHKAHVLDNLFVAFSRSHQKKQYVQDLLLEQADLIYDHIVIQKGHFYVCGSIRMGQAVKRTLVNILELKGNFTHDEAKAYVRNMVTHDAYVAELW